MPPSPNLSWYTGFFQQECDDRNDKQPWNHALADLLLSPSREWKNIKAPPFANWEQQQHAWESSASLKKPQLQNAQTEQEHRTMVRIGVYPNQQIPWDARISWSYRKTDAQAERRIQTTQTWWLPKVQKAKGCSKIPQAAALKCRLGNVHICIPIPHHQMSTTLCTFNSATMAARRESQSRPERLCTEAPSIFASLSKHDTSIDAFTFLAA